MKRILFLIAFITVLTFVAGAAETNKANIQKLIVAVSEAGGELKGIPFADVIKATTGKQIVAFDTKNEIDRELLSKIGSAMGEVLKRMNATNSIIPKP